MESRSHYACPTGHATKLPAPPPAALESAPVRVGAASCILRAWRPTSRVLFGPDALRALAGRRSFERGAAYAADGRVKGLKPRDGEVSATVRGARAYQVRLWLAGGEPQFSCTCPVAADGQFCKHCVAVGLVACASGGESGGAHLRPAADDVRAYLEGLDKAHLVDLLLAQADGDELLRGRLELEAAGARGVAADVGRYRRAIRDVISPGGFIEYRAMSDYARGVRELVDSLTGLLAGGFAAALVDLCEHALACLEEAFESVDDSDGYMSDIRERLVGLHHEACLQARPEPVALAERLFELELHSDWEIFYGAAGTYADVLGEAGLAAYRRRAEEVWELTPALAPGEGEGYSSQRFRITRIMETLAGLSPDVDALVAIKARDLRSPYQFFQIAEIYGAADRNDDALTWAERGLEAYPDCTDVRLLEVLAGEYERRGRAQDAVSLMWSLLERRPTLDSFQRLKAHAARAEQWDVWRTQALDRLRQEASPTAGCRPELGGRPTSPGAPTLPGAPSLPPWGWAVGRSEVVKALLWEGDGDAAWEEAVAGGCTISLWMEVAAARAVHHPEDALPIYRQQVERSIDQKNKRGYAEAVELLHSVRVLMDRLGTGDEFPAYLATVRAAHKQKRNLVKLLDEARVSLTVPRRDRRP